MKKLIILSYFILTSLFINGQPITDFEVSLNVRPSFSPSISYSIKKSLDTCNINGVIYILEKEDSLLLGYFAELEKIISENFHKKEYKEDNGIWTDGTTSTITVKLKKSTREFNFDNSGKNSLLKKFIPPLYNIIHYLNKTKKSKFKLTELELRALELSEETVIDFPIRMVSKNPLKYRLYGRVYYCCYKQVNDLFDNFPKDKLTYIEISRFYSINRFDEFYKIFTDDIAKRKNIRWIVPAENKDELISLGLPKENIINKDN